MKKKSKKIVFLPKVVPLFLSVLGGDSFPPPEITTLGENLPSISNGPPFLVEVHCGSVGDVLWDLLYIFHWKVVNRAILLSLQNIVISLPSAPRFSNYTLQGNIIHYYFLQSVWDFFIYLHLSDRVRASIIPSNDNSVGPST
jgi:hypothetical protein